MASQGSGKKKARTDYRLRFTDSVPGMFTCRDDSEFGDKLLSFPAGSVKFYYTLAIPLEPFDSKRFLQIEWEPVGDVQDYANEWWRNNYADWRAFIAERIEEPDGDFPFWCLGIDFIPKRKGAKT